MEEQTEKKDRGTDEISNRQKTDRQKRKEDREDDGDRQRTDRQQRKKDGDDDDRQRMEERHRDRQTKFQRGLQNHKSDRKKGEKMRGTDQNTR